MSILEIYPYQQNITADYNNLMESFINMKYIQNLLVASLFLSSTVIVAQQPEQVKAQEAKEVVQSITKLMNENYIFPDVAKDMGDLINKKLSKGKYKTKGSPYELAEQLTSDLQSVSKDLHIRVIFDPKGVEQHRKQIAEPEMDLPTEYLQSMRRSNFGFKQVEILDGNIGYLNLTGFYETEYGGETAVAAMNMLSNTDALIIDLRKNGGGSPTMIQLISSYLFESEPVHLNNFYWRPSDKHTQTWTLPHVSGHRRPNRDVYVLTSKQTFSAAEEFSYNLQNLERAILIGETTGGGAHPGGTLVASDRFLVGVPQGRAINPITKTNWEGIGVKPDIESKAENALTLGIRKALDKLSEQNSDKTGDYYRWHLATIKAKINPVTVGENTLKSYAGQYGPRNLIIEDGELFYQRDGRPKYLLQALNNELFVLADDSGFRLKIIKKDGEIFALQGLYENGSSDQNMREK